MRVIDIYRQVTCSGLRISTDGSRITVYPGDRLTNELRSLIRANKPELMSLLIDAHKTTVRLVAGLQQIEVDQPTDKTRRTQRPAASRKVDS